MPVNDSVSFERRIRNYYYPRDEKEGLDQGRLYLGP